MFNSVLDNLATMKITTPNYQIPEIIPLQWVRTLTSGANQPIVIRGIEINGTRSGEYVLKYRGAERMDDTTCRRELLAAWMATEIDIHTPEPVLIHVDAHFAQNVPIGIKAIMETHSLGLNFGNHFIEGKTVIPPNGAVPSELLQTIARIFLFDLLIQNGDRRPEKPNSFVADGKVYIIDHELAFGFLSMLPMFANPKPWFLNDTDILAAQSHLFYPLLRKSRGINWEAASSTLLQLTPQFWQRANGLFPEVWHNTDETDRIRHHIEGIQQHLTIFLSEICNKIIG